MQAQNNSLILNGAYIKINNGTWASPVYVVVNAGTPAGIQRNSGHIISELEGNFVRWMTNDVLATTAYTYPFGYSTTDYLPVTVNKTSVGAVHINNASAISVSTWGTPSSNLAWGNTVTSMTGLGGADEFNSVIDRWWQVVEAANVSGTLNVSYRGAENTTLYPAGTFAGQEWENTSSSWTNQTGSGVGVIVGIGTVTGILITPYGLTTSSPYILSDNLAPLPIELTSFTATCENNYVNVNWSNASENNLTNIELQKSSDMNIWNTVYVAQPNNSASQSNYNFKFTESFNSTIYFRLMINDNDGTSQPSSIIFCQPCNAPSSNISAFYNDESINVLSDFFYDGKINYSLFDSQGKRILSNEFNASKGVQLTLIPVQNLSNGIYYLNATSNSTICNQKIIITK